MKTKSEQLLTVMNILAWIVFIGLMIKAGAVLISYFVSIGTPIAATDLYRGMDLSTYRQHSFGHYSFVVIYTVLLYVTQAYIAFLMTCLLSQLHIARPFNVDVVKLLQKISYAIVGVWLLAMVHNIHVGALEKHYGWAANYLPGEYVFLAGIVYILAQLFKRGVEIQTENELTI